MLIIINIHAIVLYVFYINATVLKLKVNINQD